MTPLDELVEEFARNVIAQTNAILDGKAEEGNVFAARYVQVWEELRDRGNAGRDALAELLSHERSDVRACAAAFLLRHRTCEAKRVLEQLAAGEGLAAFEASQALARWREGDWNLDSG